MAFGTKRTPWRARRARHGAATLTASLLAGSAFVFGTGLAQATGATATPAKAASFPVTVQETTGTLTIAAKPTRIISLSPTATETLFALGAGAQVVAVDSDSDYPKSAPHTTLSGLTPNVEAIAKYRPDLVIVSYLPAGFAHALGVLHIPLLYQDAAANLPSAYAQIDAIGAATGHARSAESLVAKMRSEIASAIHGAPKVSASLTYYFELDPTYYSVTSSTFVGSIMALFHLTNLADRASGAAASGGYPQLSAEYIVKANPDLIFLADTICCHQDLKTVAARAGWNAMRAVKDHAVVSLNDDIASRWGPRIVDLVQAVEHALRALRTANAA